MSGLSIYEVLGLPWGNPLLAWVVLLTVSYSLLASWGAGGRCTSKARLDGKVVVITGANTGIGLETAKELAARGAQVHLLCRDQAKGKLAVLEVGPGSHTWPLDLSSLPSVRECASLLQAKLPRIDILINNAGVMACPLTRTSAGHELQLATNHLGPFLLTQLLLPLLRAAPDARVVTVSSMAHKTGQIFFDDLNFTSTTYRPFKAYNQSKLANILFTKELARREMEAGSQVAAYCLHPGVVKTELSRYKHGSFSAGMFHYIFMVFLSPFCKSPRAGAQTSLHCSLQETSQLVSGGYYVDCVEAPPAPQARDMQAAARLWQLTARMVEDTKM